MFDPVDVSISPAPKVRRYFAEVPQCFLYGFRVACAVLCRALLESALVETLDPDRQIKKQHRKESRKGKLKGKEDSYLLVLIEKAAKAGILVDDRPLWAERIKNAGDKAIHERDVFDRKYNSDQSLANLVDNTRKILEDLYSPISTT
jgi:hypothetical protein